MKERHLNHVYGPVPSRRLGRSLGIDLVPYKTCTYDCIYCHLGRTTHKTLDRKEYVAVEDVLSELELKLSCGDVIDHISLAGSGEPTLNNGSGDLIRRIKKKTGIPIVVLTNGSLLWMNDVQNELMSADIVIPSLDVGDEPLFRHVNRPHENISLNQVVDGLANFTNVYRGEVWLEVLLIAGLTGIQDEVNKIASLIRPMHLTRIQINTVVRPPAETYAKPLTPDQMLALKAIFPGKVDIISDAVPGDWHRDAGSGGIRNDVLSLISRRPCTGADVACSLGLHLSEAIKYLDSLRNAGKVTAVHMSDKTFYAAKESSTVLRP
jgi:wyosine [tRNA(Phe)-imidazoG37] synthetase (radical SAM superfamily)